MAATTTTTTTTLFRLTIDATLFDRAGDVIGTRTDMGVYGDPRDAMQRLERVMDDVRYGGVAYSCYWSMEQYRVDADGNMETVRVWDRRRAW